MDTYRYDTAVTVVYYELMSANSLPSEDPASWILEGTHTHTHTYIRTYSTIYMNIPLNSRAHTLTHIHHVSSYCMYKLSAVDQSFCSA